MPKNVIYSLLLSFLLFEYSYSQDTLNSSSDYTLKEIKVVSNKLDTELINVSTKVDIISEKEIESANGERLPDVLKSNSSVFLKYVIRMFSFRFFCFG